MSDKDQALKAMVDKRLDQALADSFPASDPGAFIQPVPVKKGDRKLPIVEAANDVQKPRSRKSGATRA